VSSIEPVPAAQGQLFISCVNTQYEFSGYPLDAAVLVDAHQPGQTLTSIPGAHPVNPDGTIVDDEATGLTARRVGTAWLVVRDGTMDAPGGHAGQDVRRAALDALSITRFAMPNGG
jgi:hypothetical protein